MGAVGVSTSVVCISSAKRFWKYMVMVGALTFCYSVNVPDCANQNQSEVRVLFECNEVHLTGRVIFFSGVL